VAKYAGVIMTKTIALLESIYYSRLISSVRTNLFIYWHTKSKTPLIIVSAVLLVCGLIGLTIKSSISDIDYHRDITCLALNIYHEARGESRAGQYAVANVTMNRTQSRHYPDEVCQVVFQKNWDRKRQRYVGAFSWTEISSRSDKNSKEWKQALEIADSAYNGTSESAARDALFYHAYYIKPRWAKNKKPVAISPEYRNIFPAEPAANII
jgi:N-acetylmuramoyl-L-alanine amidase